MKKDVEYIQSDLVGLSMYENAHDHDKIYHFEAHELESNIRIVWKKADGFDYDDGTTYRMTTVNNNINSGYWVLINPNISNYSIF